MKSDQDDWAERIILKDDHLVVKDKGIPTRPPAEKVLFASHIRRRCVQHSVLFGMKRSKKLMVNAVRVKG